MTSFVLREILHHAREQSSKVFVCCLDGKQAFDYVWHDGLFYKLLDLGVEIIRLGLFITCTKTHSAMCGIMGYAQNLSP